MVFVMCCFILSEIGLNSFTSPLISSVKNGKIVHLNYLPQNNRYLLLEEEDRREMDMKCKHQLQHLILYREYQSISPVF